MDENEIPNLLRRARTIAVVGMKDERQAHTAAHAIPRRLRSMGYEVYPVNPTIESALGRASVSSVAELEIVPDIIDVFRRIDALPGLADEILALPPDRRPAAVWFQTGIRDDRTAERLRAEGIMVVQDRCLGVDASIVGGPARD